MMDCRVKKDECGFQHVETGTAWPPFPAGGFVKRKFSAINDDRVDGGEKNMKKLYQAVILDTAADKVETWQWIAAEDREQAFAQVDLAGCSTPMDSMKVFLNKIGEYN